MSKAFRKKLRDIGGFLSFLSFLALMFSAAHFITRLLLQRTGWTPAAWLVQVFASMLGIILAVGTLYIVLRIFRRSRLAQQMQLIAPLLDAFRRIARGDFDVQVEPQYRGREMELFGELATGVNSMAQKLKEVEAMRQEFISDVSHEIQSPLTSIRGFAQALRNEQITRQEHEHYLQVIESESTRLSKLSDNLLALTTLDAATMQIAPMPFRLDKQIRHLVLACEPQWASKAIDIELEMDEVTISADEDLLSQVWVNLLNNAIKFTPAGGQIRVGLKAQDKQVHFCIQDSGIGIAEADLPRLFERFFKADRARNQAAGGSGLGLAIVKKIVELHQGAIDVVSQCNMGTTFTVILPTSLPSMD
ncbi:MAG: two-component sensor histidine kinase [Caldilineaceae bacterium]|nr:two-component sensor histidine kinase [Caldilineaceae bacterium]